MKSGLVALAFGLALVSIFGTAEAAPIMSLFNSGVNASAQPLPNATIGDPHYKLVSVPSGSSVLRIITSAQCSIGFCSSAYVGDDSLSTWIRPNNPGGLYDPTGYYDYQTTFSLTGLNPATAQISGQWAVDNEGVDILINGVSTGITLGAIGSPSNSTFDSFHSFLITSGFTSGINTLDFITYNDVTNGCCNPTALRVGMTGTASVASEPASFGVLAVGLIGLYITRVRRHGMSSSA